MFGWVKKRRGEPFGGSDAYLRLLLSRYTDAANAEIAATAMPLNSGTGIWLCCRYMFCPVPVSPGVMATLHVWDVKPGAVMVKLYVPGAK